jgi:type VI protein secretion system component VasK
MLAGAWVGLLVIYRMFDKQGTRAVGDVAITSGIQWGIFLALFAAIWLAWTGLRIRRSHRAEPTLAEDPTVHLQARAPARRERDEPAAVPATVRSARPDELPRDEDLEREHRGVTREDAEQLSFELPRELRND